MTMELGADHIAAEAYAWIARIETGDISPYERAQLKEWMRRSPRHAAEIRAIAALSAELAGLTELLEPVAAQMRSPAPARRGLAHLAAAAAAVLIAVTGFAVYTEFFRVQTIHAFYGTAVGEYATKVLLDGSSIKLNTDSAVEVTYGGAARNVRLIQGEAYFDVAKDAARPFFVYAGTDVARAVGTAFSVRLGKGRTELLVTEGLVEFSRRPAVSTGEGLPRAAPSGVTESGQPVLVKAGYGLQSTQPQASAQKLTPVDERKLAWTNGLFSFSDTPLSDVVSELSRHTTLHIEIADPALRDVKFGGVFPVGDVEALLTALPRVGVAVAKLGDNEVRLYSEDDLRDRRVAQ